MCIVVGMDKQFSAEDAIEAFSADLLEQLRQRAINAKCEIPMETYKTVRSVINEIRKGGYEKYIKIPD